MAALDDSIAYYTSKLILQYRGLPKASQTIAILVKQALADMFPLQVERCYDIATATGVQLDVLGKYIGVPRQIGDPTPIAYFGFVDYVGTNPQNLNGFSDYTNAGVNPDDPFFSYTFQNQQNIFLPDDQYRAVMLLKIILNHSDSTLASIDNYLQAYFGIPGFTVHTNGVPPSTVTISGGQVTALFGTVPTGNGYTVCKGPYIFFTGGGGSGAYGQAIIGTGSGIAGRIIGYTVLNGGSGYSTAPTAVYCNTLVKVTDNLNMSLAYDVYPGLPISLALLEQFLPRPMGVGITVVQH